VFQQFKMGTNKKTNTFTSIPILLLQTNEW